ncbi:MAG: uroporphyrinogen decarboxylase family protein [Planctomycetota bacterium]
MTRRDRLLATLRGAPVDRPAVSFYELNGLDENPADPDPFNIYLHPSWRPLIAMTRDRTDRIVMRSVPVRAAAPDPVAALTTKTIRIENGSRHVTTTIATGGRVLTGRTRRDPDVNTLWTTEHLLKDAADVEAYLALPEPPAGGVPDPAGVLAAEAALGDTGIVMINASDPLCAAASLFDMGDYTILAMTERALFRRLLDRFAREILPRTEAVAAALPGRLWRIVGPEYATAPFLPPDLFREYVTGYVTGMVAAIHRHGGFARVHCHGNLRGVLDHIAATGAMGLDPVEPPPQGDVALRYVRERYGKQFVLFGNLEVSDIEILPPDRFAEKVQQALDEGTAGEGRGFVLMPSACPYGRELPAGTLRNYAVILDTLDRWAANR